MNIHAMLRSGAAATLYGVAVLAAAQPATAVVGEATMVIGVARLFGADGKARPVERGTAIRVGDRVETEAGGHVHVRFVDGGRLSVRPSSRLHVESYNQAQDRTPTAIKFRLDEGVVRSITGLWGEAERDRFRLNTPVAAIGVKGTDFVVRSDPDKTAASVYTGAIVLSPLTETCRTTLGPCRSGREQLLSEDMKGQMLELARNQGTPQLVPLVDLLAQNRHAPPATEAARAEKTTVAEVARQDVGADKSLVTETRSADVVTAGSATPPPAPPAPPVAVTPPAPPAPPPPPVVALPSGPPEVTQLVWGRWMWTGTTEGDISRTFAEATASGRKSTVGNGSYGLFRTGGDSTALLQTTEAAASFRLAGSSAQYVPVSGPAQFPVSGPAEPARVEGGSLHVDFSRATFATQLTVSSRLIGYNSLQADGVVKPNGYLQAQGGNAYIAGALSLDGKEAGYFFEKAFPAGNLSGITLWGR